YFKIHPTDGIKKEDKFRAMALAVADELPNLLEICKASYKHVVQPVLKPLLPGNNMQDLSRDLRVPGVQMATDGDLHSLRKTSIPELLGEEMLMLGRHWFADSLLSTDIIMMKTAKIVTLTMMMMMEVGKKRMRILIDRNQEVKRGF
ncbi:hypothetical protein FOC4_g10000075, partial [Fusarium odoratissimum]